MGLVCGDGVGMGFLFQAEDGIRDHCVTGVQTCALPIYSNLVNTTKTETHLYSGSITEHSHRSACGC